MNILFLTMNVFTDIHMHNIYSDLMLEFIEHGHKPYIVTPREKKTGERTSLEKYKTHMILKVQIGNTSDVSFIEKGISTVLLERQFKDAIKKYLRDVDFGLILYSTPPITLGGVITWLKKEQKVSTYLMLKDIFPQNAVDIGLFGQGGLIHRYFRQKERQLYKISDYIGCMSPANAKYLLKHNRYIPKEKVHLLPNCIRPHDYHCTQENKERFWAKYNIPYGSTVFMYGGNLGKPQDIPFVVQCMDAMRSEPGCYYIVCGSGSEYHLLEEFVKRKKPENFLLINGLPKEEYDELLRCCDVGLLFLDHRFTIPNFPSRMLSYMECGIPILACTDPNSDVGKIAERNGFGVWCESNSVEQFVEACRKFIQEPEVCGAMGKVGREYLERKYSSNRAYRTIMYQIKKEEN